MNKFTDPHQEIEVCLHGTVFTNRHDICYECLQDIEPVVVDDWAVKTFVAITIVLSGLIMLLAWKVWPILMM